MTTDFSAASIDNSFYAKQWPDIVFESSSFLYAKSYLSVASELADLDARDTMLQETESSHRQVTAVDGGSLLIAGKDAVVEFEYRFGQLVREKAMSIGPSQGPTSTDSHIGGAQLRCFGDIQSKSQMGLHLWHQNCALMDKNENFKIETSFDVTPSTCDVSIAASKRGEFPLDVDFHGMVKELLGTDCDLVGRFSDCSVKQRKVKFRLDMSSIGESGLCGLITTISDIGFKIAPITKITFAAV